VVLDPPFSQLWACKRTELGFFIYISLTTLHQSQKFSFEQWVKNHKDGSNQRLKRDEAIDRNQDKKAMAADIWYLLQNFGGQKDPSEWSRRSTTLAVEHAAANVRVDKTCRVSWWNLSQGVPINASISFGQIADGTYPISKDNNQKYSRLSNRTFDQNRVSINYCQCETPWNSQTHDCNQVAEKQAC